jgi:hypothetical protein
MAIIFYASETQLTPEHVPVVVKGWRTDRGQPSEKTVWVRATLDEDACPGPAMTAAKPLAGEVPLNATPNSVVIVPKASKE